MYNYNVSRVQVSRLVTPNVLYLQWKWEIGGPYTASHFYKAFDIIKKENKKEIKKILYLFY